MFSGRNQKKCLQGGKGAVAPQLLSTINFNRPEKGAGFFSPPKYLVLQRLIANSQYLRHFVAFCGVLRQIGKDRECATKIFITCHNIESNHAIEIENHNPPPPLSLPSRLGIVVGAFTGARGGGTAAYSRIAAGG